MSTPLNVHWIEPEATGGARAGEVRKLSTLLEASEALTGVADIRSALRVVLRLLHRHHCAVRSSVIVLNEQSELVEIDVSEGPPGAPPLPRRRRATGITDQVIRSGRPLVIPRIRPAEPLMRQMKNCPGATNGELTYLSVPIVLDGVVVGALDLELPYNAARDYHLGTRFTSVLASMIARAVQMQRLLQRDRHRLPDGDAAGRGVSGAIGDVGRMIGTSGPMRLVTTQVMQVAPTTTTVLIRGESGTGKELIADAIHANSPRARKPLVKVNCAALPHDLLEVELFGYEQGAFTGADAAKKGRLELAQGGTLFLDEIGELDLSMQIKLLRVLQTREFERVGGTVTLRADVRLVAATNKDLEKALLSGQFRNDLYHRLNVFTIFVAPLRMRKPDVLLLADEFLRRFAQEHGKSVRRISTPAIDMMMSYHWPGNVRELANAIERAVIVCDGGVVLAHHLPPTLQTAESSGTGLNLSLDEMVAAVEKDAIQDALKTSRGNRATAARLLRTTPRIFNYKVRNYGIDWRRFAQ